MTIIWVLVVLFHPYEDVLVIHCWWGVSRELITTMVFLASLVWVMVVMDIATSAHCVIITCRAFKINKTERCSVITVYL